VHFLAEILQFLLQTPQAPRQQVALFFHVLDVGVTRWGGAARRSRWGRFRPVPVGPGGMMPVMRTVMVAVAN
jgi:hypothetical protein